MSVSYVYFIDDNRGCVKIGKAANPESRLKELSTGSATKLSIWHTIMCPSDSKAIKLESALHRQFKQYRMNGEWFVRRPIELWFEEEVEPNGLFMSITEGNFVDCYLMAEVYDYHNKPIRKTCISPQNVQFADDWKSVTASCECGQIISSEYAYCPNCGKRINWSKSYSKYATNLVITDLLEEKCNEKI